MDYPDKWPKLLPQTNFAALSTQEQEQIRQLAHTYCFTLQELKHVIDACIDLDMWGETSLFEWWQGLEHHRPPSRTAKKVILTQLSHHLERLKRSTQPYPPNIPQRRPKKLVFDTQPPPNHILGMCPVASPKTLCCQLRTLDVAINCGFGCSYCSNQSFFAGNTVTFFKDLRKKLQSIPLDPNRRYHIGTGQSSDSLQWGNRSGVLDTLLDFARFRPNVLLELKTKSDNVAYLLKHDLPTNVVVSWSLNSEPVVLHEEHGTSPLKNRLHAARLLADRGARVGFHLHPLIHHPGWQNAYSALVAVILRSFDPIDVAFVSMGSLTLPRPALRAIRRRRLPSKILQTPLVPNPEGKWTYPDSIKHAMFGHVYEAFRPWHHRVFFYLCMEEPRFWLSTFGRRYPNNDAFEEAFLSSVWEKIRPGPHATDGT